MSFVHYLTIGRFSFGDGSRPPSLLERVVAHSIPDGLRRLERVNGFIQPFSDDELAQMEAELRRRFDLEVNLRDYLTSQGLFCIRYTDVPLEIAQHVALIAHELFGAVAGERGKIWEPASLRRASERCAVQNAERRRLWAIEDGADRVREVVQALERPEDDPRRISIGIGRGAVADVAAAALPDLIAALSSEHEAVRRFAAASLEDLGVAAAEAIPALTAAVRDPEGPASSGVVSALAAMGKAAEEGLVLALNHRDRGVRFGAIQALGALGEISDSARERLVQIAAGKDEHGDEARKALWKLGHLKSRLIPPEPRYAQFRDGLECPHCHGVARQYRWLTGGVLVCGGCGRSFKESTRSKDDPAQQGHAADGPSGRR